jgi:invasion protein IalB
MALVVIHSIGSQMTSGAVTSATSKATGDLAETQLDESTTPGRWRLSCQSAACHKASTCFRAQALSMTASEPQLHVHVLEWRSYIWMFA